MNRPTTQQIEVRIRNEASSAVYRAALSTPLGCAFGFLLGTQETFESPAVEFSLISTIPRSWDEVWHGPELAGAQLSNARQVATHAGVQIIGLFAAWDDSDKPRRHQLFGLWVDMAREMGIRYIVLFSTTAHETLWAPSCYFAGRFPHTSFCTRATRGRLSNEPRHNPRRIRALWHELTRSSGDA